MQKMSNICKDQDLSTMAEVAGSSSSLMDLEFNTVELPPSIEIKESSVHKGEAGAFSKLLIQKDTRFGPYKGEIISAGQKNYIDYRFAWEVFEKNSNVLKYTISAMDPKTSNWMRHVNCARFYEEQNILSVQEGYSIFYVAMKDIKAGEELLTWFDPKLLKRTQRRLSKTERKPVGYTIELVPWSDEKKFVPEIIETKRARKKKVLSDMICLDEDPLAITRTLQRLPKIPASRKQIMQATPKDVFPTSQKKINMETTHKPLTHSVKCPVIPKVSKSKKAKCNNVSKFHVNGHVHVAENGDAKESIGFTTEQKFRKTEHKVKPQMISSAGKPESPSKDRNNLEKLKKKKQRSKKKIVGLFGKTALKIVKVGRSKVEGMCGMEITLDDLATVKPITIRHKEDGTAIVEDHDETYTLRDIELRKECDDICPCLDKQQAMKTQRSLSPHRQSDKVFVIQFTLLPEHKSSSLDNKIIYKCDICDSAYNHAFSLKRHYLSVHINHRYLSQDDITACQIETFHTGVVQAENMEPTVDSGTQSSLKVDKSELSPTKALPITAMNIADIDLKKCTNSYNPAVVQKQSTSCDDEKHLLCEETLADEEKENVLKENSSNNDKVINIPSLKHLAQICVDRIKTSTSGTTCSDTSANSLTNMQGNSNNLMLLLDELPGSDYIKPTLSDKSPNNTSSTCVFDYEKKNKASKILQHESQDSVTFPFVIEAEDIEKISDYCIITQTGNDQQTKEDMSNCQKTCLQNNSTEPVLNCERPEMVSHLSMTEGKDIFHPNDGASNNCTRIAQPNDRHDTDVNIDGNRSCTETTQHNGYQNTGVNIDVTDLVNSSDQSPKALRPGGIDSWKLQENSNSATLGKHTDETAPVIPHTTVPDRKDESCFGRLETLKVGSASESRVSSSISSVDNANSLDLAEDLSVISPSSETNTEVEPRDDANESVTKSFKNCKHLLSLPSKTGSSLVGGIGNKDLSILNQTSHLEDNEAKETLVANNQSVITCTGHKDVSSSNIIMSETWTKDTRASSLETSDISYDVKRDQNESCDIGITSTTTESSESEILVGKEQATSATENESEVSVESSEVKIAAVKAKPVIETSNITSGQREENESCSIGITTGTPSEASESKISVETTRAKVVKESESCSIGITTSTSLESTESKISVETTQAVKENESCSIEITTSTPSGTTESKISVETIESKAVKENECEVGTMNHSDSASHSCTRDLNSETSIVSSENSSQPQKIMPQIKKSASHDTMPDTSSAVKTNLASSRATAVTTASGLPPSTQQGVTQSAVPQQVIFVTNIVIPIVSPGHKQAPASSLPVSTAQQCSTAASATTTPLTTQAPGVPLVLISQIPHGLNVQNAASAFLQSSTALKTLQTIQNSLNVVNLGNTTRLNTSNLSSTNMSAAAIISNPSTGNMQVGILPANPPLGSSPGNQMPSTTTAHSTSTSNSDQVSLSKVAIANMKPDCTHNQTGKASTLIADSSSHFTPVSGKIITISKSTTIATLPNPAVRLGSPVKTFSSVLGQPEDLYRCHMCVLVFKTMSELKHHIKNDPHRFKGGIKQYACLQCSMRFSNKNNLMRHNLMNHQENENYKFRCFTCGKGFSSETYLKMHARFHSGKNFPCKYGCVDVCFPNAASLVKHLRAQHAGLNLKEYLKNAKAEKARRKKLNRIFGVSDEQITQLGIDGKLEDKSSTAATPYSINQPGIGFQAKRGRPKGSKNTMKHIKDIFLSKDAENTNGKTFMVSATNGKESLKESTRKLKLRFSCKLCQKWFTTHLRLLQHRSSKHGASQSVQEYLYQMSRDIYEEYVSDTDCSNFDFSPPPSPKTFFTSVNRRGFENMKEYIDGNSETLKSWKKFLKFDDYISISEPLPPDLTQNIKLEWTTFNFPPCFTYKDDCTSFYNGSTIQPMLSCDHIKNEPLTEEELAELTDGDKSGLDVKWEKLSDGRSVALEAAPANDSEKMKTEVVDEMNQDTNSDLANQNTLRKPSLGSVRKQKCSCNFNSAISVKKSVDQVALSVKVKKETPNNEVNKMCLCSSAFCETGASSDIAIQASSSLKISNSFNSENYSICQSIMNETIENAFLSTMNKKELDTENRINQQKTVGGHDQEAHVKIESCCKSSSEPYGDSGSHKDSFNQRNTGTPKKSEKSLNQLYLRENDEHACESERKCPVNILSELPVSEKLRVLRSPYIQGINLESYPRKFPSTEPQVGNSDFLQYMNALDLHVSGGKVTLKRLLDILESNKFLPSVGLARSRTLSLPSLGIMSPTKRSHPRYFDHALETSLNSTDTSRHDHRRYSIWVGQVHHKSDTVDQVETFCCPVVEAVRKQEAIQMKKIYEYEKVARDKEIDKRKYKLLEKLAFAESIGLMTRREFELSHHAKKRDQFIIKPPEVWENYENIWFGKKGMITVVCSICHRHFSCWDLCLRHQLKKHPHIEPSSLEMERDNYVEDMYYYYPMQYGILAQTSLIPDNMPSPEVYVCTRCGFPFKNLNKLHQHIITCDPAHEDVSSSSSSSSGIGSSRQSKSSFMKKKLLPIMDRRLNQDPDHCPLKAKVGRPFKDTSSSAPKAAYGKERPKGFRSKSPASTQQETSQYFPIISTMPPTNEHKPFPGRGSFSSPFSFYSGRRRKNYELLYNPQNHTRRREMYKVLDQHQCHGCNLKFKSLSLLERHVKKCSGKDKLRSQKPLLSGIMPDDAALRKQHTCRYCSKRFTYLKGVDLHYKRICAVRKVKEEMNQLTSEDYEHEEELKRIIEHIKWSKTLNKDSSDIIQGHVRVEEDGSLTRVVKKRGWPRGLKKKVKKKGFKWTTLKRHRAEDDGSVIPEFNTGQSCSQVTIQIVKSVADLEEPPEIPGKRSLAKISSLEFVKDNCDRTQKRKSGEGINEDDPLKKKGRTLSQSSSTSSLKGSDSLVSTPDMRSGLRSGQRGRLQKYSPDDYDKPSNRDKKNTQQTNFTKKGKELGSESISTLDSVSKLSGKTTTIPETGIKPPARKRGRPKIFDPSDMESSYKKRKKSEQSNVSRQRAAEKSKEENVKKSGGGNQTKSKSQGTVAKDDFVFECFSGKKKSLRSIVELSSVSSDNEKNHSSLAASSAENEKNHTTSVDKNSMSKDSVGMESSKMMEKMKQLKEAAKSEMNKAALSKKSSSPLRIGKVSNNSEPKKANSLERKDQTANKSEQKSTKASERQTGLSELLKHLTKEEEKARIIIKSPLHSSTTAKAKDTLLSKGTVSSPPSTKLLPALTSSSLKKKSPSNISPIPAKQIKITMPYPGDSKTCTAAKTVVHIKSTAPAAAERKSSIISSSLVAKGSKKSAGYKETSSIISLKSEVSTSSARPTTSSSSSVANHSPSTKANASAFITSNPKPPAVSVRVVTLSPNRTNLLTYDAPPTPATLSPTSTSLTASLPVTSSQTSPAHKFLGCQSQGTMQLVGNTPVQEVLSHVSTRQNPIQSTKKAGLAQKTGLVIQNSAMTRSIQSPGQVTAGPRGQKPLGQIIHKIVDGQTSQKLGDDDELHIIYKHSDGHAFQTQPDRNLVEQKSGSQVVYQCGDKLSVDVLENDGIKKPKQVTTLLFNDEDKCVYEEVLDNDKSVVFNGSQIQQSPGDISGATVHTTTPATLKQPVSSAQGLLEGEITLLCTAGQASLKQSVSKTSQKSSFVKTSSTRTKQTIISSLPSPTTASGEHTHLQIKGGVISHKSKPPTLEQVRFISPTKLSSTNIKVTQATGLPTICLTKPASFPGIQSSVPTILVPPSSVRLPGSGMMAGSTITTRLPSPAARFVSPTKLVTLTGTILPNIVPGSTIQAGTKLLKLGNVSGSSSILASTNTSVSVTPRATTTPRVIPAIVTQRPLLLNSNQLPRYDPPGTHSQQPAGRQAIIERPAMAQPQVLTIAGNQAGLAARAPLLVRPATQQIFIQHPSGVKNMVSVGQPLSVLTGMETPVASLKSGGGSKPAVVTLPPTSLQTNQIMFSLDDGTTAMLDPDTLAQFLSIAPSLNKPEQITPASSLVLDPESTMVNMAEIQPQQQSTDELNWPTNGSVDLTELPDSTCDF